MESVIPRLVQSLHKRKDGPLVGVSELLLNFVAAYEHIPSQRRLDLFVSLVNKVGPGDYLFALIAILLDKHPSNGSVMHFAIELTSRYSVDTRLRVNFLLNLQVNGSDDLQMVKQLLDLILDAQKPKPTFSKSLIQLEDVERAVSNLFPLASATLNDTDLISKVRTLCDSDEGAAKPCALFETILEETFILSEHYRGDETGQSPR